MISVNGSIAGLSVRVAGAGQPVLFIHGFPLDSRMWGDQLVRLPQGYRGIAVDLRGFGNSSDETLEPISMESQADDLARLIGDIGEPVDIVGLSMGGYVSLALLERHPELVRSLVLVDTKAAADSAEAREGRNAAIDRLLDDGRAAFVAGMLPGLVAPEAGPVVRGRLRTMGEDTPYESIVAALSAMRDRPDRSEVLAAAAQPLTVIVGERDTLTPPDVAEATAALVEDSILAVIPGAGHMSPMEAPDDVAAALRRHLARLDR